jgi:thiol:disulfide interchange protein
MVAMRKKVVRVVLPVLVAAVGIAVVLPLRAQQTQIPTRIQITATEETQSSELPKPKLLAVKFHADWCAVCKQMEFLFEDLNDKFDGRQVLFVTLDITNQTRRNHAQLLAAALGLESLWKMNAGKTGTVYLLNPGDKQVLTSWSQDHDFKTMSAEIEKALQ